MNIEYFQADDLKPAPWRATYLLAPDKRLLVSSLRDFGWLYPVITNLDGVLIDGHARYQIASTDKKVPVDIPVNRVDVDEIDAMIMHVRLNMGKGRVVARHLSRLCLSVLRSTKYDEEELAGILHLNEDEMDLLLEGTFTKARKIDTHQYNKAWVPIEVPKQPTNPISIERPPTEDK